MAAKVLQFARDDAKESPVTKKLREIQRANDQFWSTPAPNIAQAGLAFAQLRKAQQKMRARKPRPKRKEKLAQRDQRIRTAGDEGKAAAVVAKKEHLSARQVRRILGPRK